MIRFEDGIEGSETWTLKDLRVERMGVKCDDLNLIVLSMV